jgi:imidazolonepropionase-like amidohydrolase
VGKLADLVILEADPLADIRNIRKIQTVMQAGKIVDTAHLPQTRVLSRP